LALAIFPLIMSSNWVAHFSTLNHDETIWTTVHKYTYMIRKAQKQRSNT
jgi:hypothetical protein